MDRSYYLSLAARGLRMPIGTDLVLHEQADPESIVLDGERLGKVVEGSARRWTTPVAIPLMDLRLEKADLLRALGIAESDVDLFHFDRAPEEDAAAAVRSHATAPFAQRNRANLEAVRYIAAQTDLLPVGMAIGPFSLMTKLVKDPITPVAMAGTGVTADEDDGVRMVERCLEMAEVTIHRTLRALIEAGAKAVLICEPAANRVFLSPKQLERNPGLLDRFVLEPNLRLRSLLDRHSVDLIFHDCGELTDGMVQAYASRLHPVILSLGSSRNLWEDAALVPDDVVLYGNLPTKTFYSDTAMPEERVAEITRNVVTRMRAAGHPHILGSECDVLHVPESAAAIRRKVDLMLNVEVKG